MTPSKMSLANVAHGGMRTPTVNGFVWEAGILDCWDIWGALSAIVIDKMSFLTTISVRFLCHGWSNAEVV